MYPTTSCLVSAHKGNCELIMLDNQDYQKKNDAKKRKKKNKGEREGGTNILKIIP